MPELFEEADAIVAFTDAPSENEAEKLTSYGRTLFEIDTTILELEDRLKAAKEAKTELTQKTLPDYMIKVGQDRIGLAEFGVDLVLEDYYHANISSDWEPERRQAAFDWLESRGHGDLVKCVLTVPFPRFMLAAARWLQQRLREMLIPDEYTDDTGQHFPEALVEMTVPWNTLTAFVKEQVRAGNEIDLEMLGATVGKVVKIKERKDSKRKKRG